MRPNILTALALSLVLTLAAGHTALAQSSLQDNLGPLATAVDLGDDGTWATAQEGGWFTLRNANSDGAVRYYHKGFPDLADQNLRARVNLFTQSSGDGPSFAGLIFNYKSPEDFMAVAISDTGGAHYFVRGANGYDTDQIDNVTARLDGSDVLEVRVEGNTIYTELNGAPVFSVNVNGQITRELGIIAIGRGVSGFNNLAVDAVSQTPALPTPNPAPDNQGSDTLPPANPGQGDTQPPALPGGQTQPPALPGGGGADGPPPLPGGTGGGGTQPPALPGQNQPPALPGQSDGPPPIPGQNQPPALPGGQNQPPRCPGRPTPRRACRDSNPVAAPSPASPIKRRRSAWASPWASSCTNWPTR